MIVSDFECLNGHRFEDFVRDTEWDHYRRCPKCQRLSKRILTFRGGFRADPVWLDSACMLLQPDDPYEKRIESRTEFDKYLKEHNIIQRC